MRIIIFALFAFLHVPSQAQWFQKDMFKQRRADKEATQWTLGDYLAQKRQMSLMDLWLSQNRSQNIFDLALVGASEKFDISTSGVSGSSEVSESGSYYSLSFYAFMLGLQAEIEKVDPDSEMQSASINWRILGAHLQSTNLILRYGIQKIKDESSTQEWSNPFAVADLTIYIVKFLGLHGSYRAIFAKTNDQDIKLEGSASRAGLFIESGFIRLFGEFFKEDLEFTTLAGADKQTREGHLLGLGFYF